MSNTDIGFNEERSNIKVLICVPRTRDGGGANYFNAVEKIFTVNFKYFYRGNPNWPETEGLIRKYLRIIKDYYSFTKVLITTEFNIVHINTHFGGRGLYRDLLFLSIAKSLNKKVIWFFHGWKPKYLSNRKNRLYNPLKKILFKADALITLSSKEKNRLLSWGYNKPIYIESTVIDKDLIKNVTKDDIEKKYSDIECLNLLFLARVIKGKGIYETINAFKEVRKRHSNISLIIAGKGEELDNVKDFVGNHDIQNVVFQGFVEGEKKIESFRRSHVFILPTYSEGMPNAVLEAFAFGLPVITTNVGGLSDIFTEPKNGFFTKKKDMQNLSMKIEKLISDKELMKRISLNNYAYARENYLSTIVVNRLENIYLEIGKFINT